MLSDITSTDPSSGHDLRGFLRNLDPMHDFVLVWSAGAVVGGVIALALWLLAA